MISSSSIKTITSASRCAHLVARYCRGQSTFSAVLASSRYSYLNNHNVNRTIRCTTSSSHSNSKLQEAAADSIISKDSNNNNHQPPLLGRIGLVSCTTALATPAFPALGFLYAVLRVTVPDANARKLMEGRWGTVLSFTTWTLLPNLYHGAVTSLILPCAVSNALVAGCTYGLIDVIAGGPKEGMTQSMNYVMSVPFATEVSVATGAVAGMIMHPLLYYPIHGISGIHWGFPLAAVTSALYFIYYGRDESGLPVPEGSYIDPSKMDLVDSILRYNNTSGEVETYSLRAEDFIGSAEKCLQGREIAESSRSYSSYGNKVVFDDRLLAFVYNFWDVKTATRYPDHIVANIPSTSSLQEKQDSMVVTDASVATILRQNDLNAIQTAIDNIDDKSPAGKRPLSSADLKSLEEVNVALELLMLLQQASTEEGKDLQKQYTDEIPRLEKFIRKNSPKIVLYAKDEKCKGESVESQLRNGGWKGTDISNAMEKWRHVQEESYKSWRNKALLATSVVVSVGCSLLLSR